MPHLSAINLGDLLENVPETNLVEELQFLRNSNYKLSELKIDARIFKYLKKLNVFEALLPAAEEKKWHQFNLTECIMLKITETLWKYGYDSTVIQLLVNELVSDSWVRDYVNQTLLNKEIQMSQSENYSPAIPFLEYSILERQKKPNLRSFTNLDALIIIAIISENPVSIVLNDKGNWRIFTGLKPSEPDALINPDSIFKNTFVNLTIKGIIDSFLSEIVRNSPILNPSLSIRKNLDKLLSKGFDFQTARDIDLESETLHTELVKHDPKVNIGKLKTQFSNQDILIKIRDSKTASIQQLVITNNKK